MAYDIIRRKMTNKNLAVDIGGASNTSVMGVDAMDLAKAIRNPAVSDDQAARAIKKGTWKGGLKIGAAAGLGGLVLGYFIRGRR